MPIAVLLALAAAFAALGRWQLARADFNRAELDRFAVGADLPSLSVAEVDADPRAARHRRVETVGRYLPDRQVLLDNMTRDGRAGFEVLTPFEPAGATRLVLVNRGWIAAAADRRLPDVAFDAEPSRISGRIAEFPRAALDLGRAEAQADRGLVVLSYPSVADLEAALARSIEPYQLKLDASHPEGFDRDWRPDPDLAMRNVGYAVQWFAFASVAAGGAVLVAVRAWRRVRRIAT
jgi:cytochrome oxidase assembly protein ShyY1